MSWFLLFSFAIHAWLPRRLRLPFFIGLTLVTIQRVLGFQNGAWLTGLSLLLIGACHLPIAFSLRVLSILGLAIGLAALRAGWIKTSWAHAVLPILGSMFMFRMLIYLYDLRHEKEPVSFWQRLAYFFLFPNVWFPFFPVIDYKTFLRTYYNDKAYPIYQRGLRQIFRGISHLLIYRAVYYFALLSPEEVQNFGSLAAYLISSYLLVLRISGHFHLIVGILCLFGFNLPRPHLFYFLATDFSDYWRRANVYWRDFLTKMVYYPVFMGLKGWSFNRALTISTATVFLASWFFHVYQWFWIQGVLSIRSNDFLFWTFLGGLVWVSSLRQVQSDSKSLSREKTWSLGLAAMQFLGMIVIFASMCLLWSFWTSESIANWLNLFAVVGKSRWQEMGVFFLSAVAAMGAWILFSRLRKTLQKILIEIKWHRAFALTGLATVLLTSTASPELNAKLGHQARTFLGVLREDELNRNDQALVTRGYYENIVRSRTFLSKLSETRTQPPPDWKTLDGAKLVRYRYNIVRRELVENIDTRFHGVRFRTNEWGMRDKSYSMEKPSNTHRIALLGSSASMGSGVEDHETFESLVEDRLNQTRKGRPFERYEILNFSVGAYTLLQQVELLPQRVFRFKPDAVLYVVHGRSEIGFAVTELAILIERGIPLPQPKLQEIRSRIKMGRYRNGAEVQRQLFPMHEEFFRWGYQTIVEACRAQGAVPIWVGLPPIHSGVSVNDPVNARLKEMAEAAGFVVWDLTEVQLQIHRGSFYVAPWDWHPSAKAHQLIAQEIFERLTQEGGPLYVPEQA